jgi:hypothetical protein
MNLRERIHQALGVLLDEGIDTTNDFLNLCDDIRAEFGKPVHDLVIAFMLGYQAAKNDGIHKDEASDNDHM